MGLQIRDQVNRAQSIMHLRQWRECAIEARLTLACRAGMGHGIKPVHGQPVYALLLPYD